MVLNRIKSYAKLNLALNIIGKTSHLHKIETVVMFASLHDEIQIKKIKAKKHTILFTGKFSNNINKKNTVSKLLEILEKKNLLKDKKFKIKVNKRIPNQAGLGGGSMNAASILNYFVKKKIIKISKKEVITISKMVSSDVMLGLKSANCILSKKNEITYFTNCKKIHILIVKPNFGCSTRDIYSKVKGFIKPQFDKPNKRIFNMGYLKKLNNSLEPIVLSNYKILRKIKSFLENLPTTEFVRITGSGSAIVAYFQSKEKCDKAKNQFNKNYKNYWCIASKTI